MVRKAKFPALITVCTYQFSAIRSSIKLADWRAILGDPQSFQQYSVVLAHVFPMVYVSWYEVVV